MEMKMTINPLTLLPDHMLSAAPLRQDQIRGFSLPACEKGVNIQIGKDISVTFQWKWNSIPRKWNLKKKESFLIGFRK